MRVGADVNEPDTVDADDVAPVDSPEDESPATGAVIERPAHDPRIMWTTYAAVLVTLIGVFSTWASGSGVTLNGVEGSHNGWIAVLAVMVSAGVAVPLSRASGPAMVAAGLAAARVVITVITASGPPDLSRAWGWWVTLVGGLVLLVSFGWAIVYRATSERNDQVATIPRRTWHRVAPVLAVSGIVLLVVLSPVIRHVLVVGEDVSWPPPADAVTASGAQEFTESFVAAGSGLDDLDVDYAWTTAASVDPWPEGVNFFPRMFDDVAAAEDSVHIMMFGFNSGQVGTELVELLVAKLDEGVEVRVLVDSYGSRAFGEHEIVFETLAAAGADVVVNDVLPVDRDGLYPDRSIDWGQQEVGHAEHRKLVLVDGLTAWNGGAGIEDHFIDGRFHDVMVQVTGDVVRQAQAVFLTSFVSHGGELPADLGRYFPEPPDPGTIPTALLQVVPGGFASGTQAVREMIDSADERLDVMNPYLTDADMIQRLVNAAERGVDVRIVVSAESNNGIATAAAKHHYGTLLDAGAEVWEYPGAVVHAKLVVSDDTVQFGTLNFDAWALYRDFELSMMVESAELAELMDERVFGPDIAISSPGEPPSGIGDKIASFVADKLAYFF